MVSLSYNDSNNQLTVVIVKARNLKAKDINGLSGMYSGVGMLVSIRVLSVLPTSGHPG